MDQNLLDRAQVSFRVGHINMHSGIQIYNKRTITVKCALLRGKKTCKERRTLAGMGLVEVCCLFKTHFN